MSEFRLSFPACAIAGGSSAPAGDIALSRRCVFPPGIEDCDGVRALLAIHKSRRAKCPEWDEFLIETLTRFIVHVTYPQGSLDDVNVAWLRRMLAPGGAVNSALELELLLHVIAVSADIPVSLSVLALDQLRLALGPCTGAYCRLRPIQRKGITRHDLDYVHRVLNTSCPDGSLVLAPQEITLLHDIDRLTEPRANHPAWGQLLDAMRPSEDRREHDMRRTRWLRAGDAMLLDEGPSLFTTALSR